MAKKVAVLAVNPVNGFGLFQYLESFFENGITYKVYAVADSKEIKTNSGIALTVDDVIANLKGHEDEYDAMVFACGDAVPVFQQNASKQYNIDLMDVIKNFGEKGKIMIGHCAAVRQDDEEAGLFSRHNGVGQQVVTTWLSDAVVPGEIGRASCRERV